MTTTVEVASTPGTVRWGRLPGAAAHPVAAVEQGGTVIFQTVSHEGILQDQGADPRAFFAALGADPDAVPADAVAIAAEVARDPRDGPHVVTGPVAVQGARPGDLLRVEVLDLTRRVDFGIVSNRHGKGVLAGEFPVPDADGAAPAVFSQLARVASGRGVITDRLGRSISFALGEFLGLIGVAPAGEEELNSTPPGPHGGNLDVRHMGRGSAWLFPVQAEGALLYAGDPHFAQGNGEIALTAFEAPLTATLRVSLEQATWARRLAARILHPVGETAGEYLTVGLAPTLDEALAAAVRHALALVVEHAGLTPESALAYLSAAADFEISQAVNGVRGVHCRIRKQDLESVRAR